jgi:hypothetical protein
MVVEWARYHRFLHPPFDALDRAIGITEEALPAILRRQGAGNHCLTE